MPELRNIRWERFCQLYVVLGNASLAYRQAGYPSKTPDVNAAQLLVKPSIANRLQEIRVENQRKFKLSLESAVELLSEIATTPIGDVTRHSRLAQACKVTENGDEIRMPDKIAAIQELGRIGGWHSAERLELSAGSTLTKYLSDLRAEREPLPAKAIEIESERRLDEPPSP